MRWLKEEEKDLNEFVSTIRFDASHIIQMVPFILHPLYNKDGGFDPIPCWLEYLDPKDNLTFAVRCKPSMSENQTLQTWMSLPLFEARWNYKDVLISRAVAQRIPGGRIGTVKLHHGMLWTMIPPSPCMPPHPYV